MTNPITNPMNDPTPMRWADRAGLRRDLVESYAEAMDDTRAKLTALCVALGDLIAGRPALHPRLSRGWSIDPQYPDEARTGVPLTAEQTTQALTGASEYLAVLVDALRACLSAQREHLHALAMQARRLDICGSLETPCSICEADADEDRP